MPQVEGTPQRNACEAGALLTTNCPNSSLGTQATGFLGFVFSMMDVNLDRGPNIPKSVWKRGFLLWNLINILSNLKVWKVPHWFFFIYLFIYFFWIGCSFFCLSTLQWAEQEPYSSGGRSDLSGFVEPGDPQAAKKQYQQTDWWGLLGPGQDESPVCKINETVSIHKHNNTATTIRNFPSILHCVKQSNLRQSYKAYRKTYSFLSLGAPQSLEQALSASAFTVMGILAKP